MLKVLTVKVIPLKDLPIRTITVSSALERQTEVRQKQSITLKFGSRKITATVARSRELPKEAAIFISESAMAELLLPGPLQIKLLIDTEGAIWHLGPMIGIFANRFDKKTRPFGEQTGFFRKLAIEAKKLNALFFAFSPKDIDWDAKTISGLYPLHLQDSSTEWATMVVPFPDVIFDRGLFPRGEKRASATKIRKILRVYPGVKFFNPAFFGKWKTHYLLSKHDVLNSHLPDTRLYSSFKDVVEMMEKHKSIYLKPSGGSSGRGIIRVAREDHSLVLTHRTNKQVHRDTPNMAQLQERLKTLIGSTRYIVQQEIKLARVNECLFDIRALMQRDINGHWLRTGFAARVAGKGNITSNIHAGGRAAKLSLVLKDIFKSPIQIKQIINEIREICSLTAAWVTSEGNPLFGEFALDLGIDHQGRVWIIELNAIPGRTVFRKIEAAEIAKKALARPMEYAYYLSGFNPFANDTNKD